MSEARRPTPSPSTRAETIVGRVRLATGWGPDAVIETVLDAVRALAVDAGIDIAAIRSVGIGIPGQVEPGTARVVHAVNLGVDELDLAAAVEPVLGVPGARRERRQGGGLRRLRSARRLGLDGLPQSRHRNRRGDRRRRRAVARCTRHRRRGRAHLGRPERPALPLRPARLHRGLRRRWRHRRALGPRRRPSGARRLRRGRRGRRVRRANCAATWRAASRPPCASSSSPPTSTRSSSAGE